jgi:hypothetical protein
MTNNPENPLNLPLTADNSVPDVLTLLSLIREDISKAVTPHLSREDEKAFVIVSSVAHGVFVAAIALSKTGEYRFLDLEFTTVMQMWQLKGQQYLEQKNNTYKGEHNQDKDVEKGGWLSVIFHVENDGFMFKTEYNYDKPVYKGATPEEWLIAPETPTEDRHSVWSEKEYRDDLEMFPRESGSHDWLK